MKYGVYINGRYCNPALLKHRNQQAQAQASVGIKHKLNQQAHKRGKYDRK